ncbi:glycosyltransferase [Pseudomonas sp. 5P_3.1_Bac2]|uniref:glycosyltransferase n=1 Tax=Pseudomonas sp. 5P_3.1_Bac2 TaxID=2971617 RepID=UPI0021C920DF|nr:glycosyltransferase [Pseudomonas sp. 5P_3.1_Bac2]MCU1719259.1 glycosyltransferase [Pseudomonas sp. 5P_3.1_Bac2]
MIILVGSKIDQSSITSALGKPEYSYYFLLKEFLPALEQLGQVISVTSLDQINSLHQEHSAAGEQVIFLSFSPPHQTPVELTCPTVVVFAWEFDSLPATREGEAPSAYWYTQPENDWRHVFTRIAGTIATSREAAELVAQVDTRPGKVAAIPASVWDRYQALCPQQGWRVYRKNKQFQFTGMLLDSRTLRLNAENYIVQPVPETTRIHRALLRGWWHELRLGRHPKTDAPPKPAPVKASSAQHILQLEGVVYTSVFNPSDGRKNWSEMLSAFCWAFRDRKDATLLLKMTHHDIEQYRATIIKMMARLAPFQCRVVVVHGFLDDAEYRQLIEVTDYYVNCSSGEGLCIPLMEFLSSGKPAIAPLHTAMADYLHEDFAFIVDSSTQLTDWPHDPTGLCLTHSQRINWDSLRNAYYQSYTLASQEEHYQSMSRAACAHMSQFCSVAQVSQQLQQFLQTVLDQNSCDQTQGAQA